MGRKIKVSALEVKKKTQKQKKQTFVPFLNNIFSSLFIDFSDFHPPPLFQLRSYVSTRTLSTFSKKLHPPRLIIQEFFQPWPPCSFLLSHLLER